MATYKLIQDIEADDKLLGPLSFRQFIYALIAVFFVYVSYVLASHHASVLVVVTLPVALFTGFLAFPFGKDQPTEVWALAKLRFFLKPRRRIWTQTGLKELVTITVPKRVEVTLTNGLSQTEVKSRLQALANTIDSRGWAIKNVSNVYQNPLTSTEGSDRLINPELTTNQLNEFDLPESEDLFNFTANPTAQQVNQLLNASANQHRQQLLNEISAVSTDHLRNQVLQSARQLRSEPMVISSAPVPTTPTVPDVPEDKLEEELKAAYTTSHAPLHNMHTLKARVDRAKQAAKLAPPQVRPTSSTAYDPVIMNLAHRDDLNVDVIAHEVNRAKSPRQTNGGDEVFVPLR